ncbi:MAG: pyridoxal-phosphate dependent enzyme [Saprospiraceae bacterium]|nr:pyridoxal-phosphate dependent enzyme [Saprospiraceae bacterium]
MRSSLSAPVTWLIEQAPAANFLTFAANNKAIVLDIKDDILQTIGWTPLVQLNRIVQDLPCQVLAKVETFNPGHSIKDRMALRMLEQAESDGKIKPGGTIIECTSGNTGMGLAIAACVKGYKCIFTTNDKQSKEKIDILKAHGAEVIVCPTNVGPDDPRSYYSVAEKLSKELSNSFWFNQYDNLANTEAHYESTGPEIWEQTDGKVTHVVVGVGTGGTISGVAKYLKEQNPNIKIWGVDTYGSVFKKYHETGIFDESEIYPYITEGIGEDILPKNVAFDLIDHFEKVTDKDGAMAARKLARVEGILLGYSAGSAMAGLLQMKDRLTSEDLVVLIFHDHGSRYVGKIYNDDWMRERGFLEDALNVKELVENKVHHQFLSVQADDPVNLVVKKMKEKDISQMPVMQGDKIAGSITEGQIIQFLLDTSHEEDNPSVKVIMGEPFPDVDLETPIHKLSQIINRKHPAVTTIDKAGNRHVITQYDIIQNL